MELLHTCFSHRTFTAMSVPASRMFFETRKIYCTCIGLFYYLRSDKNMVLIIDWISTSLSLYQMRSYSVSETNVNLLNRGKENKTRDIEKGQRNNTKLQN